jgi:uncharacterized protein YuzE
MVINKKIEGKYTVYYPSGEIKYQVDCENNLRNGVEIEYYENGNIKMKGQCLSDKEYGRYYYYNEEQKLDSMIEYILVLDPNLGPFPYFEYDTLDREAAKKATVVENMYVKYDENGEIIMDESLYCDVQFNKDSLHIGDSIKVKLSIICPMVDLKTDALEMMLITGKKVKSGKDVLFTQYSNIENLIEDYYIGQIIAGQGSTYFKALITYRFENGKERHLFIKEPYYVYE